MLPTDLRTETFKIEYPKNKADFCHRYGLNAYMGRKHWKGRTKDVDTFGWIVPAALKEAKIPMIVFQKPVKITFYHNDNMDIDNHAAIEKMIVDELKGWLLVDDRKKFYREKVSRFHSENYILVVVQEVA